MACLDLHYYVTVHENVQKKRENKNETHMPIALGELRDDSEDYTHINADKETSMWFIYMYSVTLLLKQPLGTDVQPDRNKIVSITKSEDSYNRHIIFHAENGFGNQKEENSERNISIL